jgi:hypothetical protein
MLLIGREEGTHEAVSKFEQFVRTCDLQLGVIKCNGTRWP